MTQLITRRGMTQGLLAGGLAAPPILGPTSALGDYHDDGNLDNGEALPGLPALGPVQVKTLLGTTVILTFFMIVLASGRVWGYDLRGQQRQKRENQGDVGGRLGRLFTQSIGTRISGAQMIGALVLSGSVLFMLPFLQRQRWNLPLLITNQFISWQMGPASLIRATNIPGRPNLAALQVIGAVYLVSGLIMAILPPPLWGVDLDEAERRLRQS